MVHRPGLESGPPLDWRSIIIEEGGRSNGHCACCGGETLRLNGELLADGATVAVYLVAHTVGRPDDGAAFDLILGSWEDDATPEDRAVASVDFRIVDGEPAYMAVDAQSRQADFSTVATNRLGRADVIGTPLADQVFALVDAVYMKETRLDEMRSWSQSS